MGPDRCGTRSLEISISYSQTRRSGEHGAGRRLQLDYQVKPRSSDTLDVGLSVIGERATNNRWAGTSNGLRTEARVSW